MTVKTSGLFPLVLVSVLCGSIAATGAAQAEAKPATVEGGVALNPGHPDEYTVVKGDTLWDISARFLSKPWLWPEVWYANPQIKNPHLIYPGDVISLVYINGRPQLRLRRGGNDKLSPQVRVESLDTAIPTIPIDAIQQFLNHSRVVTQKELDAAPYIVESADEHLITGAGDRIYARRIASDQHLRYNVYKQGGKTYRDPDSGEDLGVEALYVGDASLQRFGDPSTLLLSHTTREAVIGDRLFPADANEAQRNFQPHAPSAPVKGRIIAVIDGVTQVGQHQVVVLNRGAREGIEIGHVLAIFQAGEIVSDKVSEKRGDTVTLPDESAGVLMVFQTFDRVSYALVMSATRAIHVLDKVSNP